MASSYHKAKKNGSKKFRLGPDRIAGECQHCWASPIGPTYMPRLDGTPVPIILAATDYALISELRASCA